METSAAAKLRVGAWCVDPALGEIGRDGETVRLDQRTMRLLLCLAARPGEIVSADELLNQVWPGVIVTPDSVYQAIASLRRVLGDDPKQPGYIVTVPRQGYRLVAAVGPWSVPVTIPAQPRPASPSNATRSRLVFLLTACIPVVVGIVFWLHNTLANEPHPAAPAAAQKSIAVLPFADLTEGMRNETFADGMTEELIGRFSKIPGMKVPAPSATFYYKDKQMAVADVASKLGVVYILDGSVRKSGNTLRVAARLMKADNGFIIWSETYDKPVDDLLMVQDDIADAVTKALKTTLN
ncbi:winged helix-turn-helix domain-containing protein [Duganella violaceipulchra]|uniref:TolB-like protein/DNA-binding winged helix-turn-helix (WHTH) protein n=1 Tax=Duganella violaceipulchra TaxID=2849652 RepID=A0AA41L1F2_9BURK|nr:winged helix-turn-helix domain-containing protein [Duganella violaceicalia]MBV6324701.1 winged helix-turn-helix domain-containing protein [Duganella violaceicalia]MCP2009853.1 TolB-like protein/DNA-binding winged helix-turn-helix (wHTH) protein [Duganella violaceicalia]